MTHLRDCKEQKGVSIGAVLFLLLHADFKQRNHFKSMAGLGIVEKRNSPEMWQRASPELGESAATTKEERNRRSMCVTAVRLEPLSLSH